MNLGHTIPTLAYLKRVSGSRAQATGVAHVIALPARDAAALRLTVKRNADADPYEYNGELYSGRYDMRSWRPRDGFAIVPTNHRILPLPDSWEIVHRSPALGRGAAEQGGSEGNGN